MNERKNSYICEVKSEVKPFLVLSFFLYSDMLKGDFHVKLKVSFEFFTRDFPGKKKKIKLKKFFKGFLWKIEAGGKILKGLPV